MPSAQPGEREYDIVVFGATGFTGGLTAEYLARAAPEGCRWAIAGRDENKLASVRRRLAEIDPACATLPLLCADSADRGALDRIAARTRVVVTTVGPYLEYGDPLVAACAAAGTDYLDLTGEPEFADRTYLAHDATARRTGARIVHACGFDSIPYDMGVLFTVGQLPRDVPLKVTGALRANADFSGGTYSSLLTAFSRPRAMLKAAKARRAAEPRPRDRRVHLRFGPPRKASSDGWLVPLPTIDPQIVARSAAALPSYGPDFTYTHTAVVKRLPTVLAAGAGLGALAVLAQIKPVRERLRAMRAPGKGPSERRRADSWFSVRFTGEGGGKRVRTEFSGGDPGYTETAKMLGESALCLAFDELPAVAGQVTTAVAMGEALLTRLTRAGLTIKVLDTAEQV
ncbi:saccharopine dehydrogenase NADP-binding domain-containing protein [Saccharomonospora sp. NPDC006951]